MSTRRPIHQGSNLHVGQWSAVTVYAVLVHLYARSQSSRSTPAADHNLSTCNKEEGVHVNQLAQAANAPWICLVQRVCVLCLLPQVEARVPVRAVVVPLQVWTFDAVSHHCATTHALAAFLCNWLDFSLPDIPENRHTGLS